MLEVRCAWYRYPKGPWVLREVSLALDRGEILLVTGPNGSGKTTLLKLASGLLRPQKGLVLVDGIPQGSPESRGRTVYVHETPIMARGSVLYNVSLGLILRGLEKGKAVARAREAMKLLGLEGLENMDARRLSKGLQARVAIARALAVRPSYLVLDEPTAHLDRVSRQRLIDLIEELAGQEKMGILVASHDYSLEKIADKVVELALPERGLS